MADTVIFRAPAASVEEIQKEWHELKARVGQLEMERGALEQENKTLRFLLERVIEHRQKSHGELVLLLTALVSKLPINDVGVLVSRLVEHNSHVSEVCCALAKGKADTPLPQPAVLKALDQTKRDLVEALKPLVEELIQLEAPFETEMLRGLIANPESFFSPGMVRANRGFIKGQVPRERVVREFGEEAFQFFNDMTTDPKLNPAPKPEEIMMAFKPDFEALLQQNAAALPGKREQLLGLYQRVQRSKAATEQARAQRNAFYKLSFILELLHYYENQTTEAPDVVFAQCLPVLVEQLVIVGPQETLDEKLIQQAETLLAFIINADHRQAVVNNVGKGGGLAKTLKYVLRLRSEKLPLPDTVRHEFIPEFIKHLVPPGQKPPAPAALAGVLRLLPPDMQRVVVYAIMEYDRLKKEDAEALGKATGTALGLTGLETPKKAPDSLPIEIERKMAWEKIKDLLNRRAEPGAVAAAVRERLHAKYDPDEMKQSWVTLTEGDPISLIRVFCQLPYLADGSTDPVARALMETYVSRLTHEKYASTYNKVLNSLKNMFKANAHSPTLLNFMALVRWLDPHAADKMGADIGMPAPGH
jgi:hypothetical protein